MSIQEKQGPDSLSNVEVAKKRRRVTVVIVGSYVLKGMMKLAAGVATTSPALVYDGIHGFVDVFEHLTISWAGSHTRKTDVAKYPLGRGPLLHIVGVLIFAGVVVLGLKSAIDGIATFLQLAGMGLGLQERLPLWLSEALFDVEGPGSYLWVSGVVMLVCYFISRAAFRWEAREAEHPQLHEFRDDAKELKSDSWLELGMSVSLLLGSVVTSVIGWLSPSTDTAVISLCISSTVLVGLGGWLVYFGGREALERCRSLLNPALEEEDRVRLERRLQQYLEQQVRNAHLSCPVQAFYRGEDLHVYGHILIARPLMSVADSLVARAEHLAGEMLKSNADKVIVSFQVLATDSPETLRGEWDALLDQVWRVAPSHPLSEAFVLLKQGQHRRARELAACFDESDPGERLLRLWILATVCVEFEGAGSQGAIAIRDEIDACLGSMRQRSPGSVVLRCWQVIRATDADDKDPQVADLRRELEQVMEAGSAMPAVVRAEAAFALGHHWERAKDYDLNVVSGYYRSAQMLYAESGIPSEADRLKTSWGHQLTLLHELEEARVMLEDARGIKELKDDRTSMAYVYGCLGDVHSRLGDFASSYVWYGKDIEILKETDNHPQVAGILVKQGEMCIRRGILHEDDQWVNEGLTLCSRAQEAHEKLGTSPFFAKKGQVKGLLALATSAGHRPKREAFLGKAHDILVDAEPLSPYHEGFLHRLWGRYFCVLGELDRGRREFCVAEKSFRGMGRNRYLDRASSLQCILCRLEGAASRLPMVEPVCAETKELQIFVDRMDGLMGSCGDIIKQLLSEAMPLTDSVGPALDGFNPLAYKRLIAFLEG